MQSVEKKALVGALLLLVGSVGLVLRSYPNLRPGLDVWWHLGVIDLITSGQLAQDSGWRYTWHAIWASVFRFLSLDDVWDRALIIHRIQFLLALLLIWAAANLLLRTAFDRDKVGQIELAWLSLWAAIIWFLMHGTNSSKQVMAWIGWYSINYQIALPIAIFGGACFLSGMVLPKKNVPMLLASCVSALLVVGIHPLELVYLILFVAVAILVSFRRSQAMLYFGVLFFALMCGVVVATQISYRLPDALGLIQKGDWGHLAKEVAIRGEWVVSGGRNRPLSGWNSLTLVSILSAIAFAFAKFRSDRRHARTALFIALTGLIPLLLLTKVGAGLYSVVTYAGVAWRFAFASYLFVAVPMLVMQMTSVVSFRLRLFAQTGLMLVALCCAYTHSLWVDSQRVAIRFAQSLLDSTDARQMRFGFDSAQEAYLKSAADLVRLRAGGVPPCVDPQTAYYLYFFERLNIQVLPGRLLSLEEMRGATSRPDDTSSCDFPRDGGDLRRMGMEAPPWSN